MKKKTRKRQNRFFPILTPFYERARHIYLWEERTASSISVENGRRIKNDRLAPSISRLAQLARHFSLPIESMVLLFASFGIQRRPFLDNDKKFRRTRGHANRGPLCTSCGRDTVC